MGRMEVKHRVSAAWGKLGCNRVLCDRDNTNNDITSMALKSSEARAQKRNKISNHIQEPGTYRDHHQF